MVIVDAPSAPPPHVGGDRPTDGPWVDADVTAKAPIFGRDQRELEVLRDLAPSDGQHALFAMRETDAHARVVRRPDVRRATETCERVGRKREHEIQHGEREHGDARRREEDEEQASTSPTLLQRTISRVPPPEERPRISGAYRSSPSIGGMRYTPGVTARTR